MRRNYQLLVLMRMVINARVNTDMVDETVKVYRFITFFFIQGGTEKLPMRQ